MFELKGEVLKKPQYQEKKCVQMTFHTEVDLIVGLNVKWRMILAVVNSIYAIAQKARKKFRTSTGFQPVTGAML